MQVRYTTDPADVLADAGAFLRSEPVLHNLILTLLDARISRPGPGRYWYSDGGVVFHSPLDFPATITPMRPEEVEVMVDAICEVGVALPGVNGVAATAARFAGWWTERHGSGATPARGQRLYELVEEPRRLPASGGLRPAHAGDRERLVQWLDGFHADIAEPMRDVGVLIDSRPFYVWEDGEPVSMVAHTRPVDGVVRVQYVYTPRERRQRGYAGACVAEMSRRLRSSGHRVALYTDLGNPVSNSIYRRIGYRAVAEMLRYTFHERGAKSSQCPP
jgi:uncharacterized protein